MGKISKMERNAIYWKYISAQFEPKNAKNSNSLKNRKVNDFWAENLAVWAEISAGECKVPICVSIKAT